MGYLWVLNLADGTHTLLDIARRSGLSFRDIAEAAARLKACGLLGVAGGSP
jgi:aminopeptidase-like protein